MRIFCKLRGDVYNFCNYSRILGGCKKIILQLPQDQSMHLLNSALNSPQRLIEAQDQSPTRSNASFGVRENMAALSSTQS